MTSSSSMTTPFMSFWRVKMTELQQEGEYGQRKINQYTRFLTVPLAAMQEYCRLIFIWARVVLTHGVQSLEGFDEPSSFPQASEWKKVTNRRVYLLRCLRHGKS